MCFEMGHSSGCLCGGDHGYVRKKESKTKKELWKSDAAQFPRLLAEINAVGLTSEQLQAVASSMDLTESEVEDLFNRAEEAFQKLKEAL